MGRLGIFGGTFDPPHVGHLILASECGYQLDLNQVLWVLTADPPHKQGRAITPVITRLEMVQAAVNDNSEFELSRIDIDRPPPHYAVDTVRLLHSQYPGQKLVYLMGGDSLHDLPTWHDPKAFLAECDEIGVMRRPSDQIDLASLEQKLPGITSKVCFVTAPLLEISGHEIRQRAAKGAPFRYYLPPAVFQIVLRLNLYRD